MITPPETQIPPVYHRRIGDIVVTALSDGVTVRDHQMMQDVPADQAADHLADAFRDRFVLSINAFLIYSSGRLALVDRGLVRIWGRMPGTWPRIWRHQAWMPQRSIRSCLRICIRTILRV